MKIVLNCNRDDLDIIKDQTDLDIQNILDDKNHWDEETISLYIDTVTKNVIINGSSSAQMFFSNIEQFITFYAGLSIIKEANENNH